MFRFRTFQFLLLLIPHLLTFCNGHPRGNDHLEQSSLFLTHFKFTHLNGVKSVVLCPDSSTYMVGAKIKTANFLNQTFPSVTALKIYCSDGLSHALSPDEVLLIEKNVGEWGEYKECPGGKFASGLTFHLQSIHSLNLVADEEYEAEVPHSSFNVFELGRGRYITGITLNCSSPDTEYFTRFTPLESSVTLGWNSGFGLRIFCIEDWMIAGISFVEEAIITHQNGERMIPIKITIDCSLLRGPSRNCFPELSWEPPEQTICTRKQQQQQNGTYIKPVFVDITNLTLPHLHPSSSSSSQNAPTSEELTCRVGHHVGTSVNYRIDNIQRVKNAFEPLHLGSAPGREVIPKLVSPQFEKLWVNKFNFSKASYNKVVVESFISKYTGLRDGEKELKVKLSSALFSVSPNQMKLLGDEGEAELNRAVGVKQLRAYCGIYVIFFPFFKVDFETYFWANVDGIESKVLILEKELAKQY